MSTGHAVLAPSSAGIWVHCGAWRTMAQQFPETEDAVEAAEGTAAHWVIEAMPEEGTRAPNGVLVTEEMIDGAELFRETVGNFEAGSFERKVSMERRIHPANWGTPDWFHWDGNVLRVVDYKFGHRYVEEFENWQLIDYTAGILDVCMIAAGVPVELTIVQPRHFGRQGPVRTWKTTSGELQNYFNTLQEAAARAMQAAPEAIAGDHCQFCPGRHACEALQDSALTSVSVAFSGSPLTLSPKAASRELKTLLRAAKFLEARITGLTESMLQGIRRGEPYPGFGVEQAQGRQRWARPAGEVIALGQLFGLDLGKVGTITPKQAIKAGLDPQVVAGVSEVPVGEFKLVQVDTKQARKVFG